MKSLNPYSLILLACIWLWSGASAYATAQIELPKPRPATLGQLPNIGSGLPAAPSPFGQSHTPSRDPLAVWRADQQAQRIAYFEQLNKELARLGALYDFPSRLGHQEGTTAYLQAFDELKAMLDGKHTPDLKRAVFLVENAYFNNQGSYHDFKQQVEDFADLTRRYIQQQGWDINNPMTPLVALHKMFADTVMIKGQGTEDYLVHYPITYDAEDYRGTEDLTKLFVSKVLATGTGQCYSMPQLFLMVAEELGGKAWLSYAPQHAFVKFKDRNNNWHNLELTNGNLASESWLMASGYVNAETIQSGMYMDTLSLKETIASKLVDLAYGYGYKYGYDPVMKQMLEKALDIHPVNPSGIMLMSNYYTAQVDYIYARMDRNDQAFTRDVRAMEVLQKRNQWYRRLDQLGYQDMPPEAYEAWLQSLDDYRAEQEHRKHLLTIERTLDKNEP